MDVEIMSRWCRFERSRAASSEVDITPPPPPPPPSVPEAEEEKEEEGVDRRTLVDVRRLEALYTGRENPKRHSKSRRDGVRSSVIHKLRADPHSDATISLNGMMRDWPDMALPRVLLVTA